MDQQQKFNKSIPIWSNESKMAFSNRIWNYFSTFQSSDQNLLLHCQGRSHREISLSILVCMSVNLKSIKLLGKLKRKIHWFCVKFNFNSYFWCQLFIDCKNTVNLKSIKLLGKLKRKITKRIARPTALNSHCYSTESLSCTGQRLTRLPMLTKADPSS